jgi:ERCC4-type nuclease
LAGVLNRYSQAMKDSIRATIYFDPDVHRALNRKATQSAQSISQVVNEAVRIALAQDAEDLKAFKVRASENALDFADVVKSLKRRGKI